MSRPKIVTTETITSLVYGNISVVVVDLGDKIQVNAFDLKNNVKILEEFLYDPDQEPIDPLP